MSDPVTSQDRPANAVADGKVVFAQVEPTTRCNFICGFCSGRQMDQSDFAAEDFTRLLDSFPDLEHIELQGEGEPLLHKGFFEMARQARERGIRLSMITNGSLLSEERVAAILEVGIEALYVSIESPDEAKFQDIRGGSFSQGEGRHRPAAGGAPGTGPDAPDGWLRDHRLEGHDRLSAGDCRSLPATWAWTAGPRCNR